MASTKIPNANLTGSISIPTTVYVERPINTFILVDDEGNETTAVVSEEEVILDATSNDIRLGKMAATVKGVTEGTKEIPTYNTEEGVVECLPGQTMRINFFSDQCEYTKLQALVCLFNTNRLDSVATTVVSINDKTYPVNSTEELSEVTVDSERQSIELNIANNNDKSVIIRYFTYKEEY